MKTNFKNRKDLLQNIQTNQLLYIENYIFPQRSRVTRVKNINSYFFTVLNNFKESCIINGIDENKKIGISFNSDFERIDLYFKENNMPYLSLYFNENIISGKSNIYPIAPTFPTPQPIDYTKYIEPLKQNFIK